MVIVLTAMPVEAKAVADLIFTKYKGDKIGAFNVYFSDEADIIVVTTGIGRISMASAVGYLVSSGVINPLTYVVNVGCCAGKNVGEAYLINKVSCMGRDFYPDMIIDTDLQENSLVTGDVILEEGLGDIELYDMEGAGFIEALSKFISPDKISLIKVVSDNGEWSNITHEDVYNVINKQSDIKNYLSKLASLEPINDVDFDLIVEPLCEEFKLTEYMRSQMLNTIKYCVFSELDYEAILENMRREEILPASDKRQGKEAFDAFTRAIFG